MIGNYLQSLSHWFWISNLVCLLLIIWARLCARSRANIGFWALIGLALAVVAVGNPILATQAGGVTGSPELSKSILELQLPVLISSLIWGGISVSLISNWLLAPCAPNNSVGKKGTREKGDGGS